MTSIQLQVSETSNGYKHNKCYTCICVSTFSCFSFGYDTLSRFRHYFCCLSFNFDHLVNIK